MTLVAVFSTLRLETLCTFSHEPPHIFLNCATKGQTFAKGNYLNDVFRSCPFQIEVPLGQEVGLLTTSALLGLTVKVENIGAVVCPASRHSSADRRQNLLFGHNYVSPVVPCAGPTLSLWPWRRPPLIIHRLAIAFCRSIRSLIQGRRQRQPSLSTPLLVPTPCTMQDTSCHIYRRLRLSAYCARRRSPSPPISYRSMVAFCRALRFRPLCDKGLRRPSLSTPLHHDSRHLSGLSSTSSRKGFFFRALPCRQQTATVVDRFIGNAPAAPHRQQSTPAQLNCSAEQDFYQQLCQTAWGKSSDVSPVPFNTMRPTGRLLYLYPLLVCCNHDTIGCF